MDNRKNNEVTTSFGEVMRNARVSTQQPYNKRMPEDTRLMNAAVLVRHGSHLSGLRVILTIFLSSSFLITAIFLCLHFKKMRITFSS